MMDESERNTLVQQRIKKMLQNKKRNNRESGELTKRLKSNLGDKVYPEEEDQLQKPSSSMKIRRPASAMKGAESSKTIPTNIASKPQIDVRPIISFVFQHGTKLKDVCKQRKVSREDYLVRMLQEELFLLRLMGILREQGEESWNDTVEKMVIDKINKTIARQELIRRCEQSERRVSNMLDDRIKNLERH